MFKWAASTTVACTLLGGAFAQSEFSTTITASSTASGLVSVVPSSATSPPPFTLSQTPVSTVVASATGAPGSALPSQVAVPPRQSWCPSEIFCAGPLLQTVNVAALYVDQKTFVDKPTNGSADDVLEAFNRTTSSGNATFEDVQNFVNSNFQGEGSELSPIALANFNPEPAFLRNVSNPLVRGFSQAVHTFWTQLIRDTNETTLCNGRDCESTLIPLNHTFVVPGGRFREQYYWDSFWIVEGLLESELYDIVNATLQNFMDQIETIGFIPNGGRIYYLNRSQPPLFIQMLDRYVAVTGDRSILRRALPLAEAELDWFNDNRVVNVTSPTSNSTYRLATYNVTNSAPRPESYFADYDTANNAAVQPALNETARASLYAELASGAESGWDYTTRWLSPGSADLKTLNVRNTVAVDLNSILYRNHAVLARLYGNSNTNARNRHRQRAASIRAGVLDLMWNSTKAAFYDFNLATGRQNDVFSAAHFYPFWSGIVPPAVLNSRETAFRAFSSVHLVLNRYNGTFPATFVDSHLQWDAPNAWPPHQYIILKALQSLPSNVSSGPLPTVQGDNSTFSLIPTGQLGLEESQLPGQPLHADQNSTLTGRAADLNTLEGTVTNGGNATDGEGWSDALQRQLANRYVTSSLCSWHATGGQIPGILARLSDEELNVTLSVNTTGHMFEKFSNLDIDSAGRGGEYAVQAGFGWTNGVLLWIASNYGDALVAPVCPNLLSTPAAEGGNGNGNNNGNNGNNGNGGGAEGGTSGPGNAAGRAGVAVSAVALLVSVMIFMA